MPWREAIERVLREAEGPLHYAEISEQVFSRGYYKTEGATPEATVNAQITSSIKHECEKSPFVKVGRSIFALRSTPIANVFSKTSAEISITPRRSKPGEFTAIE
ncbi:hypothetical protein CCP3SC1_130032 [Gammaproteobacteria bacterium]